MKHLHQKTNIEELLKTDDFIKQLSVDCVIFGFHNETLKVLLLKHLDFDLWSVPGGFVFQDEDIDEAAYRLVCERTNLKDLFLEQFHTFGRKDRNKDDMHHRVVQKHNLDVDENHWIHQRFVTIGYYALIDYTLSETIPDGFNAQCYWYDISDLPPLVFDHREIIETALIHLRKNLDYKVVGSNLLPNEFTMNQLQILYETILGEKLRRNNFQRKILSLGILERMEKLYTGSANKAPYLYKFIK